MDEFRLITHGISAILTTIFIIIALVIGFSIFSNLSNVYNFTEVNVSNTITSNFTGSELEIVSSFVPIFTGIITMIIALVPILLCVTIFGVIGGFISSGISHSSYETYSSAQDNAEDIIDEEAKLKQKVEEDEDKMNKLKEKMGILTSTTPEELSDGRKDLINIFVDDVNKKEKSSDLTYENILATHRKLSENSDNDILLHSEESKLAYKKFNEKLLTDELQKKSKELGMDKQPEQKPIPLLTKPTEVKVSNTLQNQKQILTDNIQKMRDKLKR